MNKTELIAEVANKAGLSRKDAEKALGAVVETITEAVDVYKRQPSGRRSAPLTA